MPKYTVNGRMLAPRTKVVRDHDDTPCPRSKGKGVAAPASLQLTEPADEDYVEVFLTTQHLKARYQQETELEAILREQREYADRKLAAQLPEEDLIVVITEDDLPTTPARSGTIHEDVWNAWARQMWGPEEEELLELGGMITMPCRQIGDLGAFEGFDDTEDSLGTIRGFGFHEVTLAGLEAQSRFGARYASVVL